MNTIEIVIIPADVNRPCLLDRLSTGPDLLPRLQELVGGYIEDVARTLSSRVALLADEDGLRKRRPSNRRATEIRQMLGGQGQTIVGDTVVIGKEPGNPEFVDVPGCILAHLGKTTAVRRAPAREGIEAGDPDKAWRIWRQHGQTEAQAEGWDLSVRDDNGQLEIEMCNNPEDWPAGWTDTPFRDDNDVLTKICSETKRHQLLAIYLEGRRAEQEVWAPAELLSEERVTP